jgi:hypothetical protein
MYGSVAISVREAGVKSVSRAMHAVLLLVKCWCLAHRRSERDWIGSAEVQFAHWSTYGRCVLVARHGVRSARLGGLPASLARQTSRGTGQSFYYPPETRAIEGNDGSACHGVLAGETLRRLDIPGREGGVCLSPCGSETLGCIVWCGGGGWLSGRRRGAGTGGGRGEAWYLCGGATGGRWHGGEG